MAVSYTHLDVYKRQALQNLINVAVTSADVLMLERVGTEVLSGASLAGQVQFILSLIHI